MKRAITIDSIIDFVCGAHQYREGKVVDVQPGMIAVEIATLKTRFHIDPSEVRKIHDRVAT
jgi:hypothetical protein